MPNIHSIDLKIVIKILQIQRVRFRYTKVFGFEITALCVVAVRRNDDVISTQQLTTLN